MSEFVGNEIEGCCVANQRPIAVAEQNADAIPVSVVDVVSPMDCCVDRAAGIVETVPSVCVAEVINHLTEITQCIHLRPLMSLARRSRNIVPVVVSVLAYERIRGI